MSKDESAEKSKWQKMVSLLLPDGDMVETVYLEEQKLTKFAVWSNGSVSTCAQYRLSKGQKAEPVSARNNLLRHSAVLFAQHAEEFDSVPQLIDDIQTYIYEYLDVSGHFRTIASYYILLTWVYDAFNELPYLRLRGDYGSGKTRALFIIGSLCQKAFFASGASTVSPIFHTLDTFKGTLVLDEADFRFSDEKSELVKIFNNGNVRGFPVLRTAITQNRVFDPRAFSVFGPKIVAMRKSFDDPALESRFLTEEMGQRRMREDIPINLPDKQKEEALSLRNKLLMYRFRTRAKIRLRDDLVDLSLSPRLNQILVPLLSVVDDPNMQTEIKHAVRDFDRRLYSERSGSIEAGVLEVLQDFYETDEKSRISVSEIASRFNTRFAEEFDRPLTARLTGNVLRQRLRMIPRKSHGVYVLGQGQKPKVTELCIRYGVTDPKEEDKQRG